MYKRKLSADEALETIKLRMKYDSSKTLNENVNLIQEQELEKDVETINGELKDTFTDEQTIVDTLLKYNTPEKFKQMLNKYKELTGEEMGFSFRKGFTPRSDKSEWAQLKDHAKSVGYNLEGDLSGANTKFVPTGKVAVDEVQKVINDTYCTNLENGKIKFGYNAGLTWEKWMEKYKVTPEQLEIAKKSCKKKTSDSGGGSGGGSTPKVTIPAELKDVKDFQDWLDKNHPGWHDKYNTLGKDVAKGYGKFGPRTTKAWTTYKDEYLKGGNTPTVTPTPTGNPDLEVDDKDAGFDQPF
jgi:hypothetical protein